MDSLGDDAIQSMLAHLDPHSIYIPAAELSDFNEDLEGSFQGIGVEFQIFDDTVNVVSVLAGGPSEKAGLHVGDKFLKVDDSVVTGNGINSDKIRKILKGPGGSNVKIGLLRDQSLQFTVPQTIRSRRRMSYMIDKQMAISGSTNFRRPPMQNSRKP